MKEEILQQLQQKLTEERVRESQLGLKYLNPETVKKQSLLSDAEQYAKQQGVVNGLLEAIEIVESIKE